MDRGEPTEGGLVLWGDGQGIDGISRAEELAEGHPVELLRFLVSRCKADMAKKGKSEWGGLAHHYLTTPGKMEDLRMTWEARFRTGDALAVAPAQPAALPYRKWDDNTLPDGTSLASPNLPLRVEEWLARMAAKQRAIDPRYLQLARSLRVQIPEWFANGAVPAGYTTPETDPPVWTAPTDPADDEAAYLLARQWLALPQQVEVLQDDSVRRFTPRPSRWTDAQATLLAEGMERDPFPGPSPREQVKRTLSSTVLEGIMAARLPLAELGAEEEDDEELPRRPVRVALPPAVAVPQPPVMADALRELRGDDGWWAAVVNDTPPMDE